MDYLIDGITVRGAESEDEAREFALDAPEDTTMIIAERDADGIELHYRHRVPFERVRRITGYLVGDLSRFNDAKLSEVNDRVAHKIPR